MGKLFVSLAVVFFFVLYLVAVAMAISRVLYLQNQNTVQSLFFASFDFQI